MDHVFLAPGRRAWHDAAAFERKLYVIRKRYQTTIRTSGIDDTQVLPRAVACPRAR